jgi:predicted nucleic acid-binding protein
MVGILLDTCVISELERPVPNLAVTKAVAAIPPAHVHLSAITIGELLKGVMLLDIGARRRQLTAWVEGLERHYATHILPVDREVARTWAHLTAAAQRRGIVIPATDGLIAATALEHGMSVMTRNSRHFAATGVEVVDPWQDASAAPE